MQPIEFKEQQFSLGAGDNPNTSDMMVAIADQAQSPDVTFVVSCWAFTPEEIEEINQTGKVYVCVMSNKALPTQPPIYLSGRNVFEDAGFRFDLVPKVEQEWRKLWYRREQILHNITLGQCENPDKALDEWHNFANAFVARNPEYTQKLEDYLKHE